MDRSSRERVLRALDRLAQTGQADLKRLRGSSDEWRLRVGDWRVRLELDPRARTIRVFRVRHRREAYR
ncbi:MAG: type II toxin-antitoxin system RelE/ParE family toxin [Chloroflexi bacterium]|nr:type II toxin-antitoxin system RelE/ParE family toxin [Chloroflexota bacterium]